MKGRKVEAISKAIYPIRANKPTNNYTNLVLAHPLINWSGPKGVDELHERLTSNQPLLGGGSMFPIGLE